MPSDIALHIITCTTLNILHTMLYFQFHSLSSELNIALLSCRRSRVPSVQTLANKVLSWLKCKVPLLLYLSVIVQKNIITCAIYTSNEMRFVTGHNIHDFQKQFETWTRQTTAHFSTLRQSISDELGPREAGNISGCCWYRAFALHCIVLPCTYGCNFSERNVGKWKKANV